MAEEILWDYSSETSMRSEKHEGGEQDQLQSPPALWSSFTRQTDGLFLIRARFLDHVISTEVRELQADLKDRRLSLRAKQHISGQLKRQESKSVNIEVSGETASALECAVGKHNLVRDAFVSRLVLFLRASDSLLSHLRVPPKVKERGGLEAMPASPLKAMEAVRDDPLFYIRHHVQEQWGCGIFDVPLPRRYDWAACWLDDKEVPGTSAHRRDRQEMARIFDALEAHATMKPYRHIGIARK